MAHEISKKKKLILQGLKWRPSIVDNSAKVIMKLRKKYPRINYEFLEDALDHNSRCAQAIFQEFSVRKDHREFNENLQILLELHIKVTGKESKLRRARSSILNANDSQQSLNVSKKLSAKYNRDPVVPIKEESSATFEQVVEKSSLDCQMKEYVFKALKQPKNKKYSDIFDIKELYDATLEAEETLNDLKFFLEGKVSKSNSRSSKKTKNKRALNKSQSNSIPKPQKPLSQKTISAPLKEKLNPVEKLQKLVSNQDELSKYQKNMIEDILCNIQHKRMGKSEKYMMGILELYNELDNKDWVIEELKEYIPDVKKKSNSCALKIQMCEEGADSPNETNSEINLTKSDTRNDKKPDVTVGQTKKLSPFQDFMENTEMFSHQKKTFVQVLMTMDDDQIQSKQLRSLKSKFLEQEELYNEICDEDELIENMQLFLEGLKPKQLKNILDLKRNSPDIEGHNQSLVVSPVAQLSEPVSRNAQVNEQESDILSFQDVVEKSKKLTQKVKSRVMAGLKYPNSKFGDRVTELKETFDALQDVESLIEDISFFLG